MTRTLKVLIGAAALAIIGVSTASAQTGPLLGRELYLFDGGAGATQNTVRLIAPPADSITSSWTFMLPKNQGGLNFILVNTDGAGKTEWQDGNGIFWRLNGNTGTTPWNGVIGNYYGTGDATDLALRAGGTNMKFWFGGMLFPVMNLNQYGAMTLQTADGYNGLVIGGQPGGVTGPDAGIVLDCALPPAVGIEVNAKATGILMPTCALPPLVGISLKAQNTGIEIDDASTGLYITDAVTGINVTGSTRSINATGTVRLNTVASDASATQILARNASNDVVYRTVAATGDVVTAPLAGTTNRLTRWTSSNQIGDASLDDNGTGTLSRSGNIAINPGGLNTLSTDGGLTVAGATALNGTLTIDVADVTLSPSHVRVLTQSGAGLVGYRTIPANGDIVVSNGPLTNNGAVYTNSTGQLQSVALTNGQILIGSNGNAPVANTLTQGAGVTITNGAGSITIAVTNPAPAGTTDNSTLRWDAGTTSWQENVNLRSTATGNTTNNGTLTLSVANTALDASDTRILTQDAITGLVGHRTVAATGDIVTAPIAGTTGRITRWTASNQIGDGSLDDNGTGTLSRTGAIAINPGVGNALSTNGNLSVSGTVTLSTTNVALDASDVRVLTMDAGTGLVSYRTIPANGDIPTSNGALTGNTALRTNVSGQIESVTLTDAQLLVGTASGPVAASITSTGNTVTITSPGNDINLEVANPLPVPALGNTNWTLRSDGTAWVASGALQNNGTDVTATGGLTVNGSTTLGNDDADAHVIRGIFGVNAVAGQAGGITIGNSGAGITNLNSSTINAPNLPSTGVNTDEFVVTDGTTLRTATVATMIGGTPWVLGGNTTGVTVANNILGINYASGQSLRVFVEGFNPAAWATTGKLTQFNDFQVDENTTLGDNDDDALTIRATTNINATNLAALNTNISTSALTNVTTIGNAAAGNNINLNSTTITAPNLPAGGLGDDFVTQDASGNLEVLGSGSTGYPWLVGGNANPSTTGLGTTTDNAVSIITNNIQRINLQNSASGYLTQINTDAATGDVIIGNPALDGDGIQLASPEILAPNIPNDPSGSTWILTYNNTTGAIEKKDLGTPVAKVKSVKTTITGAPPTRTFSIDDDFVVAGSVITVTLQDGTDVNDYTVTLTAITPTPGLGADFTIRLSGVMGLGNTKTVHYTITNP